MASLKILICGAGCAGPALAFWLARTGHIVTIIERAESLRDTGAQIDLRAQGIQVAKHMGLLETIREHLVDEVGMSFVDSDDNVRATVMANTSGKGAQSLTSEYEIMRGDLVRILYDATKENVTYRFGITLERFEQDDTGVIAYFSDGTSGQFDILVGADGQGSRIRQAILPEDADPYRRLGLYIAYWFIPRTETDSNVRKTYLSPGGRMIMRRSHNASETQVYLVLRDDSAELRSLPRAPVEQQKEFWTQRFQGAGWQTDRFLEGLKTTPSFYCQEVVQVRADTWHKGRVVLLGDAGYCPSPFSGMGTTASLVGAYVLAGEINQHANDLVQAFQNYEETLRPFVDEIQKMNVSLLRLAIPQTQWAITILQYFFTLLCFLRVPDLVARFSSEDSGGWKLPEYPGLFGDRSSG
ncbi:monooxygenase [Aspergillus lucknowensis]|uniref:Monooxygenase n=1 Tax=Aspergillus lucknowensis TaxID=176173 RepID=A0ABR4LS92_9EURO